MRLADEKPELNIAYPEYLRAVVVNAIHRAAGVEGITDEGFVKRGYPERIWHGPIVCNQLAECRKISERSGAKQLTYPDDSYRVVFVGTSQTMGAGAKTLEDTFFARVHRLISRRFKSSRPVVSINLSVGGFDSGQLLNDFLPIASSFKPHLVLANLSSNDRNADDFQMNITKFVHESRKLGILPVLVLEANSSESSEDRLHALITKHALMKKVAASLTVSVFDLHGFLSEPNTVKSGFIWWDFVHLTNYGQKLAAEWIGPQLIALIENNYEVDTRVATGATS